MKKTCCRTTQSQFSFAFKRDWTVRSSSSSSMVFLRPGGHHTPLGNFDGNECRLRPQDSILFSYRSMWKMGNLFQGERRLVRRHNGGRRHEWFKGDIIESLSSNEGRGIVLVFKLDNTLTVFNLYNHNSTTAKTMLCKMM